MGVQSESVTGTKLRVLIIEANPETQEALKGYLASVDDICVVGICSSGSEGIELAQQLNADVVLVDFDLPDREGIKTTKTLTASMPSTSAVVMSFHCERDYLLQAMFAGAKDYLTKPISNEELVNSIRSVDPKLPPISFAIR